MKKISTQVLLTWLHGKKNYVYCKTPDENASDFDTKMKKLLYSSRIHYEDLEASNCYIIKKNDQKTDYDFELEVTSHYRDTFNNFNIKRNEYIYDKVNIAFTAKNLSTTNTEQNSSVILNLLKELGHSYERKNKFVDKLETFGYKEIFFDANSDTVNSFINDAKNSLINKDFDFNDFKVNYMRFIQKESKGLEEIGIFYPVVFDHDIFKNKHYLLEINHLKFQRKDEQLFYKVDKFYKKYGVNSNSQKDILTLEEYFSHSGYQYSKNLAYFNPFKNYEKYEEQYGEIKEILDHLKVSFESFIHELFDLLNLAQFSIVKFQQENMINALQMKRSTGRLYSLQELAKRQKSKLDNGELNLSEIESQKYYVILHCLIQQDGKFKFTKNTKVDDLAGIDGWPLEMKEKTQMVIDAIYMTINKHNDSKLQYIFDKYNDALVNLAKKYKLKKKYPKILSSMLLDLIFFYDEHDKLSKSYNKKIEKIYQMNESKNYEDLVDFNKISTFILNHEDEFEKYCHFEFQDENGATKFMRSYGNF